MVPMFILIVPDIQLMTLVNNYAEQCRNSVINQTVKKGIYSRIFTNHTDVCCCHVS
jgi:hypothetical protein